MRRSGRLSRLEPVLEENVGSLAVCGAWKQNRRDLWVAASGAMWWKSNDDSSAGRDGQTRLGQ